MHFSVFSDAEWLYPDSAHSALSGISLHLPRGGHDGAQLLGGILSGTLSAVLRWDGGRGPAVRLTDEELAEVRIAQPEGSYSDAARAYAKQENALGRRLLVFYESLSRWRMLARYQPLSRLMLGLMDETGLYARAGALPGGAGRQANLLSLIHI